MADAVNEETAPSDDQSLTIGPDGPILPRRHAGGDMVRAAYTLQPEDDDSGQAGVMVREVLDDVARERLAPNIIGHASKGVEEPVLPAVLEYWRNVDADLGTKVGEGAPGLQRGVRCRAAAWHDRNP